MTTNKLTLRHHPDPLLLTKTKKVTRFDTSLERLARAMLDTMHRHQGVGLAANQIGINRRIAVIQIPMWPYPTVLVNPVITDRQGQRLINEGCLSLPELFRDIWRSELISVTSQDLSGKRVEHNNLHELPAQAVEHEVDHLNGIIFTSHTHLPQNKESSIK